MWKRKTLKKNARKHIRIGYWRMVAVCFLAAILTASSPLSTSSLSRNTASPERSAYMPEASNSEVLTDAIGNITDIPGSLLSTPVSAAVDWVINTYTNAFSTIFSLLRTVNSFWDGLPGYATLFLAVGVLLSFLYRVFISNILLIGQKRFFMEIRNYPRTRIQKIFFLYKLRFIFKPAWVMFCRFLYQFLWSLTIVGGIIKWFEYRMIPYILAENPAIGKKDAFFLSRQLMRNNKRRLFFLYLSFFGWKCLSLLTLGIFDILFVNPYLISTETELYMHLRRNYVLSRLPRYEKLNDLTLEHVPSEDELLISKALYDDSHGPYTKISYFAPEQYPAFLYSIQPPEHAVKAPTDTKQKYPFSSVCFLFFAFSVFGWLLEFAMALLRDGVFMTRSFLFGPWFPLYGICGICILLIMRRHTQRPIAAFFLGMGVYSLLEYGVSWLTELCLHIRLWDYSGYFLNLNGRIYLGGTATFALLGCAFLYYLAPKWNAKFLRLSRHSRMAICLLSAVLFAADIFFSVWSRVS